MDHKKKIGAPLESHRTSAENQKKNKSQFAGRFCFKSQCSKHFVEQQATMSSKLPPSQDCALMKFRFCWDVFDRMALALLQNVFLVGCP